MGKSEKQCDKSGKGNQSNAISVPLFEQKLYNEKVDKNGPENATNIHQGLDHSNGTAEEGLEMIVTQIPAWIADENIAIQFLEFAAKDFENAKSMRIFYAQAARKHGVTLQQIANIYGMTATGVHLMLKRADEQ